MSHSPSFWAAEAVAAFFREQAAWRHGQARSFPRDPRNAKSASALEQLALYVEALPDTDRALNELIAARAFDDHLHFLPSEEARRMSARYGFDQMPTPRTVLQDLVAITRRMGATTGLGESLAMFVSPQPNDPFHIRIRNLAGDRALTIANEELELGGRSAELADLPAQASRCDRCWSSLRAIHTAAGERILTGTGTDESLDIAADAIKAFMDAPSPNALGAALSAIERIGPTPTGSAIDWAASRQILRRAVEGAAKPRGSLYAASVEVGSVLQLLREDVELCAISADAAALGYALSGTRNPAHRSRMLHRLLDLANRNDAVAIEYLEANPELAFFDGLSQKWVEQIDSGPRSPGIAVGRSRIVRTRPDPDRR